MTSKERNIQQWACNQVKMAIERGEIPALNGSAGFIACADCGERAEQYDHRDYEKPLDVQPVCRKCNLRRGPAKNSPKVYKYAASCARCGKKLPARHHHSRQYCSAYCGERMRQDRCQARRNAGIALAPRPKPKKKKLPEGCIALKYTTVNGQNITVHVYAPGVSHAQPHL